jgi:hypothetical protein
LMPEEGKSPAIVPLKHSGGIHLRGLRKGDTGIP